MTSHTIRIGLGLIALSPVALSQDAAQLLDDSHAWTRTGAPLVLPPAPATSSPGHITVYYTNIATSPTSDVPGLVGTKFTSGNVTTAFDHQWFSPDGVHYVFRGDTPLGTTLDAVVIRDGALLWQEGTAAPYTGSDLWGPGSVRMGINNAGDLALPHNVAPTTTNDDYILSWNSGSSTYTVLAQEAGTISFLPPTVTWDDTLDSVSLLNDGRVMWRATGIDGTGITLNVNDEILVLGTAVHTRTSVDVPLGQAGGATDTWENFTIDNVWISPDGLHVLIDGDTNAATGVDEILTYDGTVVIQEGSVLPGTSYVSPVAAASPTEVRMDHAGNWYARGDNVAATEDWVVRNGTLIAATDTPIGVDDERRLLTTSMNAAQVVPPSASTGTGVGTFLVDTAANQLYYDITLTGITGETAANLHGFAGPGLAAGPLYALPIGTTKNGVVSYVESEEAGILAGLMYVEIVTTGPTGEIRGQMVVGQEMWDDTDFAECFFDQTGNTSGAYLVAGVTNAPSSVNGVVVLNGTTVVLREGDPIDIDANGLYDDDAFIQNFGDDDFTLFDDGSIAFSCTLRNGAGTAFAQGIFKRQGGNLQRAVCFGDGSGTACPCGNNSVVGQMAGCVNSIGLAGRIDSIGTASVANDTLVLQGSQVPNGPGLYFRGTSLFAGPGLSFGDGLLCAGGTIIRMGVVFASGNVSSYPGGTTPAPVHTAGLSVGGDTHYYQLWYRDGDTGYCTSAFYNLTNAVECVWGP